MKDCVIPLAHLNSEQSEPHENAVEPNCDSTFNPYAPIMRSSTPDSDYLSINISRIRSVFG